MAWLLATPTVLVAAVIVFLPGIVPLAMIGVRGLALAALAPVIGTALAAGGAIALAAVGVHWGPLSYLAIVVAATLLAWLLRRLFGNAPSRRERSEGSRLLLIAVLVGIGISAGVLIAYIADPEGISQTNDAVFHLNAVRYAVESGSASSMNLTAFTGSASFYPAAWHAIVSLVVLSTGADIAVAVNVVTLVIGAAIWPLGLAWLVRVMTGRNIIAGYAAVLAGALQLFPLLMFQWGVLYPNALSIAILPAAVALVVSAQFWLGKGRRVRSMVPLALLVVLAACALVLSQPASLLTWGLICVVWFSVQLFRQQLVTSLVARIALLAVSWAVLAGIWAGFARNTSGSHWPTFRSKTEALVDVLLNRQMGISAGYVISALMLVGLVAALRRRPTQWVAVAWLGLSGLYIAAAALESPFVRTWLLGPWYADPNRLAGAAPLMVIPLAALGVDALMRVITKAGRGAVTSRAASTIGLIGVTAFMVVLVLTRTTPMPLFSENRFETESRYEITDQTYLSIDERALLEELPDLVADGERILGNPSAGTGFGYAISGMDVYPRNWQPPTTDAWNVVAAHLREAGSDPAVCDALTALGDPQYVLDFGIGEAAPGRYVLPGLTAFAGQAGFEEVASEGDASLWRITACAG